MGVRSDLCASSRYNNVLRWMGLVVGSLAKFTCGSIYSFNAYSGALKGTFNFTETSIELQSSLLNMGLGVGFLPGVLYDRLGPTWTSITGLLVSVSSYLLLWSTTKSTWLYNRESWLVALYFFGCGLGSSFVYTAAMIINVVNFKNKHRGKILGLFCSCFVGSSSVFSAFYYSVFDESDVTNAEKFGNFMIFYAVIYTIVDILCILFLKHYPPESVEEELVINARELKYLSIHPNDSDLKDESLSVFSLMRTCDFHVILWMFACSASVSQVYVNNLTEIAIALHLGTYNSQLVQIIPITSVIVGLSIGVTSDYFKDSIPRTVFFILSPVTFAASLILLMIYGDSVPVLVLCTGLFGIGIGITWPMGIAIISEHFSVDDLGRNWGIVMFVSSVTGLVNGLIFGLLYDLNKPVRAYLNCMGIHCVRGGLGVCLGSAIISLLLCLLLILKQKPSALIKQ